MIYRVICLNPLTLTLSNKFIMMLIPASCSIRHGWPFRSEPLRAISIPATPPGAASVFLSSFSTWPVTLCRASTPVCHYHTASEVFFTPPQFLRNIVTGISLDRFGMWFLRKIGEDLNRSLYIIFTQEILDRYWFCISFLLVFLFLHYGLVSIETRFVHNDLADRSVAAIGLLTV